MFQWLWGTQLQALRQTMDLVLWADSCEAPQETAAEGRKTHERQLYYEQENESYTLHK